MWCLKKPGRELRQKTELMLAWKRVAHEVAEGILGGEFEKSDRVKLQSRGKDSQEAAKDEVWGDYRFAVVADRQEADGLKVIDLGAGHSSSGETLCGQVISALKSEALLNESVGVGYIERNWPSAFQQSGAWPFASLRQSFLDGSLTRLVDPDAVLRRKIAEFVRNGDLGLAFGRKNDGTYERWWFEDFIGTEEIAFEPDVFLLSKAAAQARDRDQDRDQDQDQTRLPQAGETKTLRVEGTIPAELWNRLGTKILPKLRSGADLKVGVDFSVTVDAANADSLTADVRQILQELGLADTITVEQGQPNERGRPRLQAPTPSVSR